MRFFQLLVKTYTCGMNITLQPIAFGTVDPNRISSEQTITVQNTGSVQGTISMSGSNWTDENNTTVMNADTTKYSITSGEYNSKTSLSENAQDVASIMFENILNIFLQLHADLLDSFFSGDLGQEIEVNLTC